MGREEMELKIYQEYAGNVQRGEYNGIPLYEHLQTGGFLINLHCERLDPICFDKVSRKVIKDMLEGLQNEMNRAPFFVRGIIRNASYGDKIMHVHINKQLLKTVNIRIDQLEKTIKNVDLLNQDFLSKLTLKSPQGKKRGMELG
jgi:hypothetical protein